MEHTVKIRWLREKLKELSVRQRLAKLGRKTVHKQGEAEAARRLLKVAEPASCENMVWTNQLMITAMLNRYHMLRGSEYRHGCGKGREYWYQQESDRLTQELAKV